VKKYELRKEANMEYQVLDVSLHIFVNSAVVGSE
jgi:hypothetical protein